MNRIQLQIDTNREFLKVLKKIAIDQDKTMRKLVIDSLAEQYPELKNVAEVK